MRVLIDTNIFIYRENHRVLKKNLQDVLKILSSLRGEILVHPKSKDEIKGDKDKKRREVVLSKINAYPVLESPPISERNFQFTSTVGYPSNANDLVDNDLLYAVSRNAVDFLISEDRGIHRKALKLKMENRVLDLKDAAEVFARYLPKRRVRRPPALKEEPVHNLNPDDPFFESLRSEYPQFNVWLETVSREGRKCWVSYQDDGSLGALLIYKVENESIAASPSLPAKKRLKLCTFKVAHEGFKIGELFIKLSAQFCVDNQIDEMYLTHFTKKEDYFAELLREYGFYKRAKKDGEDIYIKEMFPDPETVKSLSPLDISRTYYPSFYDGPRVLKFFIPIRPEYHDRLFVAYRGRQTTLPEHVGEFIIEGNTIRKAYLSHSRIRSIGKGDLLLFYRSKDRKELTSVGVVEGVFFRVRDKDEVVRRVGKRTVYPIEEIEKMVRKPTLIILFRFHFHFPKALRLRELRKMQLLDKVPQSISRIHHRKYLAIKERSGLDERYTTN